jgi:hypothetical protein
VLKRSMKQMLVLLTLLFFGHAMAQSEPSLNQVYEAAQSGQVEQAQQMMKQVLSAHPNSAKAHFVQAELFARQGQISQSREALGTAERLAPGLPFAKPEAVQKLRSQLSAPVASPSQSYRAVPAAAAPAPFPWGIVLLVAGVAVALWVFLRRKIPNPVVYPQAYPAPNALSGPQTMGMNGAAMAPQGMGPGPGYAPQAPGGMGGNLMGGLATGLAVGAGVMAAQAIGKSLMGGDHQSSSNAAASSNNGFEPIADNPGMGGQNFGVNDASSWDDGGSSMASSDDGGGWDS